MRPSSISARRARYAGRNRDHMASMRKRCWASAAVIISSACVAFSANGFSQSTCLPDERNSSVSAAWRECGVATYTASTSGSSANAS